MKGVRLTLDAAQTLRWAGVSQADWAMRWFGQPTWHGDSCGCPDDRCIGHHHDEDDACGCLHSLLSELHR